MVGENSIWNDLVTAGVIGVGGLAATCVAALFYRMLRTRRRTGHHS